MRSLILPFFLAKNIFKKYLDTEVSSHLLAYAVGFKQRKTLKG